MFSQTRHRVEITTGYPYLALMMNPPGSPVNERSRQAEQEGWKTKAIFPPNFTLTYAYRFAPRWEAGGRFNTCGWIYRKSKESSSSLAYENRSLTPSLFVRWNWYAGEKAQWYSSAGVGMNLAELVFGVEGTGLVAGLGFRL